MAGCCPPKDPERFQKTLGIAALIGVVIMGSFMAFSWVSAHPEAFRRHRDFTAPQMNESHPMPHVATDRS